MDRRQWKRFALRWCSLCGVVVPLFDMAVNGVVGALQPHYNICCQYVSDLGATDCPYGQVLSNFWVAFPFCFSPFALAVYAGTPPGRFRWVAPMLLAIFAVCIGLCGVFRCSPDCAAHTFATGSHLIVSSIASATLFPSPFFFWLATRRDPHWQNLRHFSLVMQALGIGALVVLALAFLNLSPYGGLYERTFWGVYYVWLFVVGLELFWRGRPE